MTVLSFPFSSHYYHVSVYYLLFCVCSCVSLFHHVHAEMTLMKMTWSCWDFFASIVFFVQRTVVASNVVVFVCVTLLRHCHRHGDALSPLSPSLMWLLLSHAALFVIYPIDEQIVSVINTNIDT